MSPQVSVGRLPILLFGLVIVAVLGGFALTSTMQVSGLRQQLEQKERALRELQAQHQTLQEQLGVVEQEREDFEQRLEGLRGQLASSTRELQQLQTTLAELQTHSELLNADNARLEKQVAQLHDDRDNAAARMRQLEQEKDTFEQAATRLRERLAMTDHDYQLLSQKLVALQQPQGLAQAAAPAASELAPAADSSGAITLPDPSSESQAVQLPPIVVRKGQAQSPIRARVVEVNEPHRFVILDKGESHGVRRGMAFDLLRAGETIGRAVATRVRPQLTACEVQASRSLSFPQPGDTARERTP